MKHLLRNVLHVISIFFLQALEVFIAIILVLVHCTDNFLFIFSCALHGNPSSVPVSCEEYRLLIRTVNELDTDDDDDDDESLPYRTI